MWNPMMPRPVFRRRLKLLLLVQGGFLASISVILGAGDVALVGYVPDGTVAAFFFGILMLLLARWLHGKERLAAKADPT